MSELTEVLALKLSAEEAFERNSAIPESQEKIVPARPFVFLSSATMELSRTTAVNCLTSAIYYEAATEAPRGQRAVAQVVLNRVRHPAYPNNICGVVFQGSERSTGCQFSFTCDGSMARVPNRAIWTRIQKIAADAISGAVEPSVGTATHYHTVWIVPYWAKNLVKVKTVGAHIFYRWSGYWGTRAAFSQAYGGENLSDETADTNITLDYQISNQESDNVVADIAPVDPIIAPKFEAGAQPADLPDNSGLAADDIQSPLAADNEKGSLILD